MLDINFIRKNPEKVKTVFTLKKQKEIDLEQLLEIDEQKRKKLLTVEELNRTRNEKNRQIAQTVGTGEKPEIQKNIQKEMSLISNQIKTLNKEINELDESLNQKLLWIPNIPEEDVPEGDETQNQEIRSWGEKPQFDFKPKPHWDIGAALDIIDIERGSRMSGSGFPILKGKGAQIQRALINFMLDIHIQEHGYQEVTPPHIVNRKALTVTGQLPKLEEDMYHIEANDAFLIPTAEVPLANLYQGEILKEEELPIYLTGATSCFRREAGAHGKDTRGLLRVHEFKKVELIKLVKQEDSEMELEKLLQEAETILQRLELPYRVLKLATGDLSFAAAKTYDLEVWAPGVDRWLEVSSCSNCKDFQARRGNLRYKKEKGKPKFLHLLNGSGVALPRLLVALLENNQQKDGQIQIPAVLQPYLRMHT